MESRTQNTLNDHRLAICQTSTITASSSASISPSAYRHQNPSLSDKNTRHKKNKHTVINQSSLSLLYYLTLTLLALPYVTTYVPGGERRAGYGQRSACRHTKAFKWDERQAGRVRLCDLTLPSRCPTLQPCVGPVRIPLVPCCPARRTYRIATRDL
jgi:hypothetical protein